MKIQIKRWVYCKFGVTLSPYARYNAERLNTGRYLVDLGESLFVMVDANNVICES